MGASVLPEQNLHSAQSSHWLTALCLYPCLPLPSSSSSSSPLPFKTLCLYFRQNPFGGQRAREKPILLGFLSNFWFSWLYLVIFFQPKGPPSWVSGCRWSALWSHRCHLHHSITTLKCSHPFLIQYSWLAHESSVPRRLHGRCSHPMLCQTRELQDVSAPPQNFMQMISKPAHLSPTQSHQFLWDLVMCRA